MNVSKDEQRVLHALAQGGFILHFRHISPSGTGGKVVRVECVTRDGWMLSSCTLAVFEKLRRKRLIASRDGHPYVVTKKGLMAVRARMDNR